MDWSNDLRVEDLIGRSPIHTDLTEIAATIAGSRVLVTGAGGSIGSELCRQLSALGPESLILLDRDESALHGVELTLFGSALLTSPNTVLADIRDPEALERIFAATRPQIVFHAAVVAALALLFLAERRVEHFLPKLSSGQDRGLVLPCARARQEALVVRLRCLGDRGLHGLSRGFRAAARIPKRLDVSDDSLEALF